MGTRNITIVRTNHVNKVAQYGQWDGYLSGQGATVYDVLSYPGAVDRLREAVENVSWITEDEYKEAKKSVGINPDSDYVTWDEAKEFDAHYPELSRDTGAGILQIIIDHPHGIKIDDAYPFVYSEGCEYAYVVDLDRNVLEVYDRYIDYDVATDDKDRVLPEKTGMKILGVFPLDNLDGFKELIQREMNATY